MKNLHCFNYKFAELSNRPVFQIGGRGPEGARSEKVDAPKDAQKDAQKDEEKKTVKDKYGDDTFEASETEKPWKKQAEKILQTIEGDKNTLFFNTTLQAYAQQAGGKIDFSDNVADNFNAALKVSGVPDSEIGYNTAWNNIIRIAEKEAEASKKSDHPNTKPYEQLKAAVVAARNSEPIANK